jgi:hypothetical protein
MLALELTAGDWALGRIVGLSALLFVLGAAAGAVAWDFVLKRRATLRNQRSGTRPSSPS